MDVFSQFDTALEKIWNTIRSAETIQYPFSSFPWHKAWVSHFGTNERLFVTRTDDVLLPLSISGTTAHFTGGEEFADYLDAIGRDAKKPAAWEATLSELRKAGVKTLHLRNIPGTSATVSYFRNLPDAEVTQEDTTPILVLPPTLEEYLNTLPRKDRHEFKRKMKRFEETYTNARIEVSQAFDPELLFTLMKKNPDKETFLTPKMQDFFQELPTLVGSSFHQATLRIDDRPVATTISFLTDKELLLYNSGYDPEVFGSGWYLKSKLITWCMDHAITKLNFLQGSERYKYDLGAQDFPVYQVTLQLV